MRRSIAEGVDRTGAGARDHHHLTDPGHGPPGRGSQRSGLDGNVAPGQHPEVLLPRQFLEPVLGLGRVVGVGGQEDHPRGVATGIGQVGVHHRRKEPVGNLDQDPGAVAGGRLGPGGTPVGQVLEGGHGLAHQTVAPAPVQVGHERDAAGVVFERGVVQAL